MTTKTHSMKAWLSARNFFGWDHPEHTGLHSAAWRGDLKSVEMEINRGASIGARDGDGYTALELAVWNMHAELIEYLLSIYEREGLVLNDQLDEGKLSGPVLILAAWNDDVDTIHRLLDAGADVSVRTSDGSDALWAATTNQSMAAIKMLTAAGADVSKTYTTNEETLLHIGASFRNVGVVKALLEAGANVRARNGLGETALHLAAQYGRVAVMKVLREAGANIESEDYSGRTVLHAAAFRGTVEAVNILVEANVKISVQDQHGKTPVHYAAEQGHVNIVETLIKADSNTWPVDGKGRTPATLARSLVEEFAMRATPNAAEKSPMQLIIDELVLEAVRGVTESKDIA